MSHERLKHLKDCLMCCVEGQMTNLQEADAEELGAAIDMLKDLEEAMYFSTITEAMTKGEGKKHNSEYEFEFDSAKEHHPKGEKMYYSTPTMYAEGNGGGSHSYMGGNNGRSYMDNSERSYSDTMSGRSPMSRRMYMEAKQTQSDKATQLRELEKYMQELTTDIVEMIQDASPEEKSYLEKKMTTLATKIGQMK